MYFDIAGADFFRLQRQNTGRVGDPLDPDVLFSGGYEDGQALFLQQWVDAPGTANTQNYEVWFGRSFPHPPLVIGTIKLYHPLNHNNTQFFNAGEYISPCAYRRNVFGVGVVVNYSFYYTVYVDRITVSVTGFTGTASFMALPVD